MDSPEQVAVYKEAFIASATGQSFDFNSTVLAGDNEVSPRISRIRQRRMADRYIAILSGLADELEPLEFKDVGDESQRSTVSPL